MMNGAEPIDAGRNGASNLTKAWFCLRSQPKHEHIAAARLRELQQLEVFVPRIRFRRPTKKGPVWVTEALFPNYIFARFDWSESLRLVHHSPGISGIVHFGDRWPTIPDEVINELRLAIGDDIHVISTDLSPGDQINISGGSFHGFQAVVTQVMPARDRVAVLLEFLGRQTTVELNIATVTKLNDQRRLIV